MERSVWLYSLLAAVPTLSIGELRRVMEGDAAVHLLHEEAYERYPAKSLPGGKYNYEGEYLFMPNWLLVDPQQGQATIGKGMARVTRKRMLCVFSKSWS